MIDFAVLATEGGAEEAETSVKSALVSYAKDVRKGWLQTLKKTYLCGRGRLHRPDGSQCSPEQTRARARDKWQLAKVNGLRGRGHVRVIVRSRHVLGVSIDVDGGRVREDWVDLQ